MPESVLQFPEGFVWGTSTAAYQVEGGIEEGGRGDSIWDVYARIPGKVKNGDTGRVACDHYHRYLEDIQLMKSLGLKHYRLSISWTRILPDGVGEVNEAGVKFYNDVIDALLANGIEPMVTLLHFDWPISLQIQYDGWLGGNAMQDAFVNYTRVCYERFGDRVKSWLTINEPWIVALLGYGWGVAPPARSHNAGTEPYIVAHNLLLAHAKSVGLYRREFKATQGGHVGFPLVSDWRRAKPSDDAQEFLRNEEAAERSRQFIISWFADPLYFGDYPEIIKKRAGDRLPTFTDDEKKLLKGSNDFLSLNHYSTQYTTSSEAYLNGTTPEKSSITLDEGVELSSDPLWKKTDTNWAVVPDGFGDMLQWVQKRYNPVGGIYVTENGCAWAGKDKEDGINDDFRVDFYKGYIAAMHGAIQKGVDMRGYYCWSTMDNFEWGEGFSKRFGLVWVDYETLERTPKKSAALISSIARTNTLSL
jgi:beta-galactosidase